MRPIFRLIASAVAGAATFVVSAVVVTIANLYLSGHSYPTLDAPWIDWDRAAVHVSRADVVCLVSAALVAFAAWRLTAPGTIRK